MLPKARTLELLDKLIKVMRDAVAAYRAWQGNDQTKKVGQLDSFVKKYLKDF